MRPLFLLGILLPACAVAQEPARDQPDGPLFRLGSSQWRPGGAVHAIAFSPDDKRIATAIGEHVTLWDSATGSWRASTPAPDCTALLFTGEGSTLTFNTRNKIGRWNLAQPGSAPRYSRRFVDAAGGSALAPDGNLLAVASNQGTLIRDATGRIVHRLQQITETVAIAWFPDCRTLALAERDGYVHVWDTQDGKYLRKFQFSSRPCDSARLTVAGDGQWLVVAAVVSRDKEDLSPAPELCTIDAVTGRRLQVPRLYDGMTELLTSSPDGTLVLSGSRTELYLWEALSGAVVRPLGDERTGFVQAALLPDGLGVILVGGGTARFVDLLTDADRPLFAGQTGVSCFGFSRSGQMLATGHMDRIVQVWKTAAILKRPPPNTVTAEQLPALWQALAGDARGAYLARRALLTAPKLAVEVLREQLKSQTPPSPEQIAAWIADLNADLFKVRDKATQALEQWPELAEPALRKALEGKPTLEVRRRVESLLQKSASERPTGEVLRALRAIAVLRTIGGEDAAAVLSRLLDGGVNLRVRQAAKSALERVQPG